MPSPSRARLTPRWSVAGAPALSSPVDGRAAPQEGVGLGAAPVGGERAEARVDRVGGRAHLVPVGEAGGATAVAD
jgi:hypothetical protein